jgi:alkylation response protein AidB-like acyl-CoA dehydrogenase
MNFSFSEKEMSLRKAAFETGKLSDKQSFDMQWKSASKQGMVALPVPAEFGGPELNALETAISLEGFSESCRDGGFTFSMAAHLLAGVVPVVKHASEEIKKYVLPKVVSGEFILANAMTEANSGSDAFSLKTSAEKKGEQYILNGTKLFCTNATIANGILVYALTDPAKGFFGGISCFLLEKDKHNYKCGKEIKKSGLHSSPMAEVILENVSVGSENIIGKTGSGAVIFLESMNWERACMSAMHTGVMQRLCNMSREYVKARIKGNESLDKHQAVQFRIAELYVQTEISRLLSMKAANMIDEREDATVAAAKAKIFSSEALNKIAQETMILHGANGFTEEFGIGEIITDAQASLIYSGPNDVLRNLIASRL